MRALALTVFALSLVGCIGPLESYYAQFDSCVVEAKEIVRKNSNPHFSGSEYESPDVACKRRLGQRPEARSYAGYQSEVDRQRDEQIYRQEMFNRCLKGAGGNATVC